MSTNAVAWLLLFVYREGTTQSALVKALDALRESLRTKDRDTGFSGSSKDVVNHAVSMMLPSVRDNFIVTMEFKN